MERNQEPSVMLSLKSQDYAQSSEELYSNSKRYAFKFKVNLPIPAKCEKVKIRLAM